MLAVAVCTIAQNVETNNGRVPTKSIQGIFAFNHIPTNGSHVKAVIDALVAARLIRCTKPEYDVGDCRHFALEDVVYSLPFLGRVEHYGLNPSRTPRRSHGARCD
jgi:hypothetical protein